MKTMLQLLILSVVAFVFVGACQAPSEPLTAPTTKCDRSQCDASLAKQFANATRGLCACCAILYGTGCTPQPGPNPPPTSMGGNSATGGQSSLPTATGGALGTGGTSAVVVQFPACSNTMKAPSPAEIEQYRKTLKPRHKSHPRTQRAPIAPADAAWANVFWTSNLAASLDQGSLGSCTLNAAVGCVSTKPFAWSTLTEDDAVNGYKWATANDSFPGQYPPTDTGSDGATACKALVHFGWAKSCVNFVGYNDALARVQSQPIIVGMNWLENMFTPNNCGGLTVAGSTAGGHEVEIVGYDAGNKRAWLQNSWGNSWGVCLGVHCGYFYLGVNDLAGSKLDAEFDAPNLN